jgi:hypothetical protein
MSRDEARALADEVQGQATSRNFADLAKQYSTDPGSASEGGDLGWVKAGQMIEVFEDSLFALRDGRISEVVETEFGFHIIYRVDSRTTKAYEIAHIEMPWTTLSDVVAVDPWENTELSGKHVRNAAVAIDPVTQRPYVAIEFNEEGGALFEQITTDHIGEVIGIFLDGEPITTPVVQQTIYRGTPQVLPVISPRMTRSFLLSV